MIQLSRVKSEVIGNTLLTGAWGETYIGNVWKESKKIIENYSFQPNWLFGIGCPYHFNFIPLRHL